MTNGQFHGGDLAGIKKLVETPDTTAVTTRRLPFEELAEGNRLRRYLQDGIGM